MTDAAELITYDQPSTGHGFFTCCRRTAAHLDYTKEELAKRHPGAVLVIIQGCYHRGVGASEGTHDYDCCLDFRILGLTWLEGQAFMRSLGWGGWWRRTWQGPWADHLHMFSLGFEPYTNIKVGKYVDGGMSLFGRQVTSSQVEDYYRKAWGLEGMHVPGSDDSWYPSDIRATIFNYEQWQTEQEDKVPYRDWSKADKKAMMDDVRKEIDASMTVMLNSFGDRAKLTPPSGEGSKWSMATYMRSLFRRTGTAPVDE